MKAKPFNARPLFYGFLALMLAIATSRYVFMGNVKYIVFDCVILAVFLVLALRFHAFKTLALILCVFAFGLGWFFVGLSAFDGKDFSTQVEVCGRISDDVSYSKYGGSATVVLKDVEIDGKKEGNIRLVINFDDEDDVVIGQKIKFYARPERCQLFELGSFNSFYYRDRTPYVCSVKLEDTTVLGKQVKWDESFRLKVKQVLGKAMGQRNGAVAYAMIFGDKNDLDDDVYETYRSAGIVHLLTVSGLHVSFLIVLLGWILKKCRVRGIWNFLVCFVFLLAYAMLCNFSPSILRAGVMGLVLLSCAISGKQYDGLSALGLAGSIILLFLPLMALDLGFLMSFFCVLSIYVVAPWLTRLLCKIFPKFVAQSFGISIAVEVGILPFVAQMFGTFNFLTFFVNLLVVPLFSVVFPFLVVSTLIVCAMPFMQFLLQTSGWFLKLIESIAAFFGGTKLAVNLQPFDIFFVASLFVFFFLASRFFIVSKKCRVACCGTSFALTSILFGLGFVQFSVPPLIAYGSDSVVVLVNDAGNSAIVDLGHKDWTHSFVSALNLKSVSNLFLLKNSAVLTDSAQIIGVKNVIRCDSGEQLDNEFLVETNSTAAVDGFTFTYHAYGSRLVGLEIAFDNTDVFILRDWTLTEKQLSILPIEKFDFVVLGKHDEYAQHFDKRSHFLTYYSCEQADASIQSDGNFSWRIDTNQRRCLD